MGQSTEPKSELEFRLEKFTSAAHCSRSSRGLAPLYRGQKNRRNYRVGAHAMEAGGRYLSQHALGSSLDSKSGTHLKKLRKKVSLVPQRRTATTKALGTEHRSDARSVKRCWISLKERIWKRPRIIMAETPKSGTDG